jgi:hypothetical protein
MTDDSGSPLEGVGKALASRVVSVEAGLVLLGVVVWTAVITDLNRVSNDVAFVLLGAAFVLTCLILWIMHLRTNLLKPIGERDQKDLERQVSERIRPPVTRQEYSQELTASRRESGRTVDKK